MASGRTLREEVEPLVVITDLQPGEPLLDMSIESTTSSGILRRSNAADKLNRTVNFGESSRPDDLSDDWCYVSSKNAKKRVEHATSDLDTFIHLIKGNIGSGLLALPIATMNAGYIPGPIGILFIGMIAMHCMVLLVQSANKLCEWNQLPALDYAETMQFALKERGANSKVAKTFKIIVNVFLIITQFGFCSVYFVFMGDNLQQIMEEAFCITVNNKVWIAAMILPVILFTWIRNLDNLAPLSLLANAAIAVGLIVIFYDEIYQLTMSKAAVTKPPDKGGLQAFGNLLPFFLFFGNVVFSFEGIGVVLPLENKMKKPRHAKHVIYVAMTLITFLYVIFALLGYLVYGADTQASITLNLCANSTATAILFMVTKLLFVYNIFISFLLQFYVPMDFLEPPLYKKLKLDYLTYKYPNHHGKIQTVIQLGFRTILVLVTAIPALAIPDLGDLITLIGAIASSALAMIFPPLIHMLTFWSDRNEKCLFCLPKPVWVFKDLAIITVGLLGFVFGTLASFYNIVNYFEHKTKDLAICPANDFEASC